MSEPGSWRRVASQLLVLAALVPLLVAVANVAATPAGWSAAWRAWTEPTSVSALRHTLRLSAGAATCALLVGALLAAVADSIGPRRALAAMGFACLPMLIPSSLCCTAWMTVLGPTSFGGPWLAQHGWSQFALAGAAGVLAMRYFGVAAVILLLARRWRSNALSAPTHARALAACWLILAVLCANDPIVPSMHLVNALGVHAMTQFVARQDVLGAAALALPLGIAGSVAAVFSWRLLSAGRQVFSACDSGPRVAAAPWKRPAALATGATVLLLAATVGVPFVSMAQQSGSWSAIVGSLAEFRPQIARTAALAGAAGAAVAVLSHFLARWHDAWRERRLFPWALLLNIAVPATLPAAGLVLLTGLLSVDRSRADAMSLVAGWVARFLPFAVIVLLLLRTPQDSANTGDAISTSPSPPAWRADLAVGWLCALFAAADLDLPLHLATRAEITISSRVYTLAHESLNSTTCALGTAIVLLALAGAAVAGLLLWRSLPRVASRIP